MFDHLAVQEDDFPVIWARLPVSARKQHSFTPWRPNSSANAKRHLGVTFGVISPWERQCRHII